MQNFKLRRTKNDQNYLRVCDSSQTLSTALPPRTSPNFLQKTPRWANLNTCAIFQLDQTKNVGRGECRKTVTHKENKVRHFGSARPHPATEDTDQTYASRSWATSVSQSHSCIRHYWSSRDIRDHTVLPAIRQRRCSRLNPNRSW